MGRTHDGHNMFAVDGGLAEPVVVADSKNLLQPCVEIALGSLVRVAPALAASATPQAVGSTCLVSELGEVARMAVHWPLAPVTRLDTRFAEWKCSGCRVLRPVGDVHWSNDAETNGLGFCAHKKLKEGDTLQPDV